ncbi:MAG: alkaline phosphatase family protein [Bdellovibrionota bacterium]
MKIQKRFSIYLILVIHCMSCFSHALSSKSYGDKPSLVVILVIDQFRSDDLTKLVFKKEGTGGLDYLAKNGAWFPFAEFESLQNMTCPGHATIFTGSQPASHGIGINEWYDPKIRGLTYCVQDDKDGFSPRRLRTTTVGDELKLSNSASKVISISLKDRSAIMLGGHSANYALWFNQKSTLWETSKYYKEGKLPTWTEKINVGLKSPGGNFESKNVKSAEAATKATLDLAVQALEKEGLGKNVTSDVLAVSLSSHDILGHDFGPNSSEIKEFTDIQNVLIGKFIDSLKKHMGNLDKTLIVLTSDHGIPPVIEVSRHNHIEADRMNTESLVTKINRELEKKFKAPSPWIVAAKNLHFFFNQEQLNKQNVPVEKLESEIKTILADEAMVELIYTKTDFKNGKFPPGVVGQQLKNSFISDQSGDFILVLKPFHFQKMLNLVTHESGWSYDRNVPLVFLGKNIKPGVYTNANIVDIAPTVSFLLGILPPAKSEGRVLSEIFK